MKEKIELLIDFAMLNALRESTEALKARIISASDLIAYYESRVKEAESKRPGFANYFKAKNERRFLWNSSLRILQERYPDKHGRHRAIKQAKKYLRTHKKPTPIFWP